jgi:hypothetical protein
MRPSRLLALASLVPALLAAPCGLRSIVIDAPFDGALLEDPSHGVALAARVGPNFNVATVEVRLDGVDVVAALGLVPPFTDASGVVVIGSTPVSISEFSFTTNTNPRLVDLVASGLDLGAHVLEVEGDKNDGSGSVVDVAGFGIFDPFALAAEAIVPGGARPRGAGSEGTLFGATLGQPLAAPPVTLSDGGELRSGFVEAAEALIAGGAP